MLCIYNLYSVGFCLLKFHRNKYIIKSVLLTGIFILRLLMLTLRLVYKKESFNSFYDSLAFFSGLRSSFIDSFFINFVLILKCRKFKSF